jgi:HEPN domain-containing protein
MSDQPRRPVETPGEWLLYANENLQVAKREMQNQTPAFHTVCFLCQSAAEKFLKGYLIAQGWNLEKTHDILALLSIAASYNAELETLVPEGVVLNEYLITGRYASDISFEHIGQTEAQEALNAAQKIQADNEYVSNTSYAGPNISWRKNDQNQTRLRLCGQTSGI